MWFFFLLPAFVIDSFLKDVGLGWTGIFYAVY